MFAELDTLLDKTSLTMTISKVKGKIAVVLTPKGVEGFNNVITLSADSGAQMDEAFAGAVIKEILGDATDVVDLLEQQKKLLKSTKNEVAKKTVEGTKPKAKENSAVKVSPRIEMADDSDDNGSDGEEQSESKSEQAKPASSLDSINLF